MTDVAPGRPLDELLSSLELTHADLDEVMRAALERASVERYAPITTPEREILLQDAGLSAEGMQAVRSGMERGADVVAAEDEAAEQARLAGESISANEAANLLGRSLSSVSRGASGGRLMAFRLNGGVRYPRWQFHDGAPLPGLATVVAAVPPSWRPRKVLAVMTAPVESLDGLTPVQWLTEAGDPDQIVQLLEDLDRG